jgi:hypothetical protein
MAFPVVPVAEPFGSPPPRLTVIVEGTAEVEEPWSRAFAAHLCHDCDSDLCRRAQQSSPAQPALRSHQAITALFTALERPISAPL